MHSQLNGPLTPINVITCCAYCTDQLYGRYNWEQSAEEVKLPTTAAGLWSSCVKLPNTQHKHKPVILMTKVAEYAAGLWSSWQKLPIPAQTQTSGPYDLVPLVLLTKVADYSGGLWSTWPEMPNTQHKPVVFTTYATIAFLNHIEMKSFYSNVDHLYIYSLSSFFINFGIWFLRFLSTCQYDWFSWNVFLF